MAVGLAHNLIVHGAAARTVSLRTTLICLLTVVGLAVGGTLWWQSHDVDNGPKVAQPPTDTRPRPAPTGAPPVLVTSVIGPASDLAGGDFALPDALHMSPTELGKFGSDMAANSAAFNSWYARNGGTALESATITLALRGNAAEQVQVTDVNVHKKCGPPLDGTFFSAYTQGSGDTVALGLDLDAADPQAQLRARTGAGLTWTGRDYFKERTLTLEPGERETLSIGVASKRYRCSFTLELVVATAKGVFTEQIDRQGKPFTLTAAAIAGSQPPAGYRAAYEEREDGWHSVDPGSAATKGVAP
ncbi:MULTISPECIES: hypothetical protein [Streptomyces]|uniref:Uncharacterized protein n=1 Tax=Streptomyces microflavus TaxID=1919 RepID=A0A7J0D779_STRMI|nr:MULTISPECIES: hypothetical protein [Streptomyces]MDX2982231.1 hypothetical protein [Streptomyces sp. NRRL_B-2249]WSS38736.1 hypothetical protein OG269_37120 [Streptomyces microflavus]WST12546.1 hypothetical protein OG721_00525 [Streptomyces microflavus]GFN09947.1 hypothetical protein Smic_85030 [Streptomyces microflavus]GGX92926.1 hypothetical protein GCM10010298_67700 [Streptomyces microflavus]